MLGRRALSALLTRMTTGLVLASCSAAQSPPPLPEQPQKELPPEPEQAEQAPEAGASPTEAPRLRWAADTFSPRPASPAEPDLDELLRRCGTGDQPLHEVAQWVAEAQMSRKETPSLDEVRFHLRRRGAPYVLPRLWSAETQGVAYRELKDHVDTWATKRPAQGHFRCGAGLAETPSGRVISVLQVDVLAELQPVPTRIESAGFVEFEAILDRGSTAATIVVLPPLGRPHSITPEMQHGGVSARLSLPTEGTYLIQLMATRTGGPRPVAEALVTVGEERPNAPAEQEVPGEAAFDPDLGPEDALFAMMNSARSSEGLPVLARNRHLDSLAQEHSQAMLTQGQISHDSGRGDPARRIEAAGVPALAAGENVAHAQSVIRLHRVLWSSPSHRENLLLRRWEEAGVGIASGRADDFYATQLFVDR